VPWGDSTLDIRGLEGRKKGEFGIDCGCGADFVVVEFIMPISETSRIDLLVLSVAVAQRRRLCIQPRKSVGGYFYISARSVHDGRDEGKHENMIEVE